MRSSKLLIERFSSGGVTAFVRAKVAGDSITLLVDTGAPRSILTQQFARAHNMARQIHTSDRQFVDANGNVSQMQYVTDVPVQFEGEDTVGALDFYIASSEATTQAVLVPQDLVRPGWAVVIDLGREELRYEREEIALKRLGTEGPPREIDFRRCLKEGFFERSHRFVAATINGVSTSMLVDTGASHTVLTRNNPALPSMLGTKGDPGTAQALTSTGQMLLVNKVPIVFSETSFSLPVMVSPTTPLCGHGALGADLLRYCTLVWGSSSL